MAKFKIFCTYKTILNESDFPDCLIKINEQSVLSRDEFLREVKGCHGILSNPRCPRIDAEILEAAGDQLKTISTSSAGYNYIDTDECSKRGISVGYLADTFTGKITHFICLFILINCTFKFYEF